MGVSVRIEGGLVALKLLECLSKEGDKEWAGFLFFCFYP